ncbi:Vegetative incompatibility protein HET-E-1 [Ceratocystis platani]|uniref:Vegetative incompatibility protein HET-E-1 n=1 Tax=Ceratocystis fimbriata f. sp. platani TaxID=88771 RepID=A0A0F8BMA2_CERFI|nr:Vegetative incompatibility protein HET-E-1 [Ceratocystis platani]
MPKPSCLQERIWNRAYDYSNDEEPKLVKAFEEIAFANIRRSETNTVSTDRIEDNETTNRKLTAHEIQTFVRDGIDRTKKEASFKQEIDHGLQAMNAVRGTIDRAARAAPEAAAVWAAFCIGIEVLSNPVTEALENRKGIQYVLCRMEWYWELAGLLLEKNKNETATVALREKLEMEITRLFQRLLLYQMRSICVHHRSQAATIFGDAFRIDNWADQLLSIKEAEEAVQRCSEQYNTQDVKMALQKLNDTADALRQSLQNIGTEIKHQAEFLQSIDSGMQNPILVVDALDEYSVDRQRLLEFIAKPSLAKRIVSSCNWLDIEESMDNAKQKVKIHLEINQDSVSMSVESFILSKVDQLAQKKKYDDEMRTAVLEHLRANAKGNFLWALVPDPDPLAAIQYSCVFWIDHLRDSPAGVMVSENERVLGFFKEQYLQWLESLSLIHSIPAGIRAIEKLEAYLQEGPCHDLHNIVKDARRFLFSHAEIIEVAPLQVYASALVFSPTNSLIRQQFSQGELDWIELKPRVGENWNACLQTFEGHYDYVTSVVFSNDGQKLASGSEDKTVKIWDATSGSDDKTIKVWDATSGTLEGHGGYVNSLVFSNDGQRLASGSDDETIKIWDATSGTCLQTLEGDTSWVRSVVFSDDGQRLASGSEDNSVKIWDTTSGACLQKLKGHDYWRLASGSEDKMIKIWDATSGMYLKTLEGHEDQVISVVFSNDGQRLASSSSDYTARIWDTASGACLQTLDGHDDSVASMTFSNDGQRLASGSNDETIKIWDATSGSDDKTIKIWDVTSGVCLQTLEGHGTKVGLGCTSGSVLVMRFKSSGKDETPAT